MSQEQEGAKDAQLLLRRVRRMALDADGREPVCEETEAMNAPHEPAITPSILFTQAEVESVNWDAVFAEW